MPDLAPLLTAVGEASASLTPDAARAWADPELLAAQRSLAEARRRLDAAAAVVAGEIAYRSRRELGHSGLAATFGQRTPEALISTLTGTSTRDARTLVKAAELLPGAGGGLTPAGADAVGGCDESRAGSGNGEGGGNADSGAEPRRPLWLQGLGGALTAGSLSVEQVDVIRTRLGAVTGAAELEAAARAGVYRPDARGDRRDDFGAPGDPRDGVGASGEPFAALDHSLAGAVERLAAQARSLTVEQLAVRASAERDDLDLAGVAARERELRDKRYLRVSKQLDGMTRIHGLLDPESAAIVVPVLDAATSPRRGGPRFVDPESARRADEVVRDERTTDQLALDTLVDLLRLGVRVDDGKLLGDRKPAVRILVTKADLEAPVGAAGHGGDGIGGIGDNGRGGGGGDSIGGEGRTRGADGSRPGAAYFEGQSEPVSIATAERYICASGAVPILFDGDGRVLNLGRTQRLFSEKQRMAIAARDGGCLMCDRPPSWCEAHHIDHWDEHQGRTDVDDGVLLCRHCHLLLHNRRWRIRRAGGDYRLERPDSVGVLRSLPLPARSRALQRLRTTA